MTSMEIINKIVDFYEKKHNIHKAKMEYVDCIDEKRFVKISYFRDQQTRPINKLEVTVIWKEKEGLIINSDENCVAAKNQFNEFGLFQVDELEFFDRLGHSMKICKEATNETGQQIEDWWGAKHKK